MNDAEAGGCSERPTAGHASDSADAYPAVWRGFVSFERQPERCGTQPLKLRPVMRFAHTDWASC